MSTEVSRKSLLKCLSLARPAVAGQAYIAALTHFAFSGPTVTAYNDVSAITVRAPVDDLDCCLPAELLMKALNSLSAEKVLIEEGEANSMVLAAGRSKVKLPYLPVQDFPFPKQPKEPKAKIKMVASMLKGIEKCLVGVGADPTHPAQMGITLDPSKDGAVLYSTDNFTISRYQTTAMPSLPADCPIILPTFFCTQLLALSKAFPDEQVTVELHPGSLKATFGTEAILFTKLLVEPEPMNFGSIIAKYLEGEQLDEVLLDIPDGFEAAFSRALLILDGQLDKATKLSSKGGRLKLFSSSSMGEATDSLAYKGEDLDAVHADPALIFRASKLCSKMALLPKVMIMADGDFSHLIAYCSV